MERERKRRGEKEKKVRKEKKKKERGREGRNPTNVILTKTWVFFAGEKKQGYE